jgi:5-hydroxyisourate hydrolase
MSGVSTHVLDAVSGTPAVGIAVALFRGSDDEIARAITDSDGRVPQLLAGPVELGPYRLLFDTGGYFVALGAPTFYPEVSISFAVTDPDAHHHVPLLLSPFAYSTYRGS